jgi:hypothetical protein
MNEEYKNRRGKSKIQLILSFLSFLILIVVLYYLINYFFFSEIKENIKFSTLDFLKTKNIKIVQQHDKVLYHWLNFLENKKPTKKLTIIHIDSRNF